MKVISRRRLLRRLGVSAAAAPFVPLLDRTAEAVTPPRRLLLIYSPNGAHPARYWPTGTETSFTFAPGSILEALNPYRTDLIVPRNVKRVFDSLGGDHERGIGCLWTGARLNPGNQFGGGGYPSAASIDQILGRALPLQTDFRTLEVAVQPEGPGASGDTMLHMCYAGSDQPIPAVSSPYKLFDRLSGNGTAKSTETAAQLRARRQSVIDLVRAELTGLRNKIDPEDRLKIDGHLDGIRAIESRLVAPPPSSAVCLPDAGQPIDVQANDNFPMLVKLQSDLVVAALACDRTRIATLQWSRAFSSVVHRWAGVDQDHHGVSHDQSPAGIQMNVDINRWYARQFAYLLGAMKKVPEGNGTLLDNTLVVWAAELSPADNVHDPNPVCAVMAGNLGGRLRTGRFFDFALKHDWNQMLTTICQAMGTTIGQVGDLGGSGPIPGLMV